MRRQAIKWWPKRPHSEPPSTPTSSRGDDIGIVISFPAASSPRRAHHLSPLHGFILGLQQQHHHKQQQPRAPGSLHIERAVCRLEAERRKHTERKLKQRHHQRHVQEAAARHAVSGGSVPEQKLARAEPEPGEFDLSHSILKRAFTALSMPFLAYYLWDSGQAAHSA
ncbi:hypothetical protein B0T26DRAFT_670205 [Lasiosphaeria miniovina]|uniref:Uncharacterized protein n=1 Tax=Lasiosphaeria miniovina TaxID=1954250 RepID=A0AA40BGK0_9PEZI|nr:uncharacterized protein B0T26DRAFT_670205 [Lasiosphaeria miniovina]KAK0733845.1 hypothetical protein B0T26DRAFT_670205 [Lasiosphaeria miniovina]